MAAARSASTSKGCAGPLPSVAPWPRPGRPGPAPRPAAGAGGPGPWRRRPRPRLGPLDRPGRLRPRLAGRSTLSRTVNPVHGPAPPGSHRRPAGLQAESPGAGHEPDRLEERLTDAIDGAVARGTVDRTRPPRSFLWPLIGVLQTLVTVAFAAGLLWYLTLYLAGQAQA